MLSRAKNKIKRNNRIKIRSGDKKPIWTNPAVIKASKVLLIVAVFVSFGIILHVADKYIKSESPAATGTIELLDVPSWVGDQLKSKIREIAGKNVFQLDESTAKKVAENLASVAWLDDVKVLTTDKSIQVRTRFRKPIAVIENKLSKFYVDSKQVVMDYVPMPQLLIMEIKGLSLEKDVPRYGQIWKRDDLAAAVTLREEILKMDEKISPNKPLLREIASIDVSNYGGRKDSRKPHIILYTKNNTAIYWGAELGKWSQYLESTDEQKLAKLFTYYKENKNSLSTNVQFINLCDPRVNIPLPIDKY
jgi:hypothetical protein